MRNFWSFDSDEGHWLFEFWYRFTALERYEQAAVLAILSVPAVVGWFVWGMP